MSTLTTAPLAPLLDDLFAQSQANSPNWSDFPREELNRLMHSKT